MKVRVCVLQTDGINCHDETAYAFTLAGGMPKIVHVNAIRQNSALLRDFAILVIPGGFSYGDDIHSGRVFATELTSCLADTLREFVDAGKLVLGICNGFQVLVATGLLPSGTMGKPSTTLAQNDSGRFECRWVNLAIRESVCVYTQGLAGQVITLPIAHGEGKLLFEDDAAVELAQGGRQLPLLYASGDGIVTGAYPENPNGSICSIAGMCDPTGRILGMMPHPERYVQKTQFVNWRRFHHEKPHGRVFFENAITYANA